MNSTKQSNLIFILLIILSSQITSTINSAKSKTNSHSETKTISLSKKTGSRGVCRKGLGFYGQCFNSKDKLDADKIPSAIKNLWEKVVQPLIKKIPQNPSLCL